MRACSPSALRARWRGLPIAVIGALLCTPGQSQEIVASIDQGTNMALALSPEGATLIVDLMGQLWSLPASGGGAQPLLPADESARNPRFSPDGSQLVYQRYARGQWDLWLMELATASRRRLTGPPFNETEPDFSDDGRSLVFASDRDGAHGLYRIRLATGSVTPVSRATGRVSWPSVSERGEIAYVEQLGNAWALRLLRLTGPPVTLVTGEHPLRAPSWRPGGGVLLYTEETSRTTSDLKMVVLSDEPVVKTLTSGEDVFGFRPAWSSPAEFMYTADGRIWRRTIGSATRRAIPLFAGVGVTHAATDLRISVAPKPGPHAAKGIRGLRAAATGQRAVFTALGDLWLLGDSGDLRQLTNDSFVDIDPVFTPDEKALIFASDRAGSMDLWSLVLETGYLERLSFGPEKSFAPAVAPDGRRVAYLATTGFGPWAPSELRVLSLDAVDRHETLARDLYDAGDLAWDQAGDTVAVWARDPAAAGGLGDHRARYEIDLEQRAGYWNRERDQPGRELLPGADAPPLTWSPAPTGEPYVIQVDRLFDGIGTQYRHHMDIHIENGRVTAVVARGLRPLPEKVIDARGFTALPGLIDLHAHQSSLSGERLGRAWLAYGVTTVREVASLRDDGLERKEAWASGRRLGPRLLLSARHNDSSGWRAGGESAHPAYDVLELYRGEPAQLSRNLRHDARRFGIPIFSEDLFPAVRRGINGLEHIGGWPASPYDLERSSLSRSYADVIEILTQSGAVVTPTLAAFGGFAALAAENSAWADDAALRRFFTREERAGWRGAGAAVNLEGLERTVATLVRSGARVTAGSDAPGVPYGLGLHAELSMLTRAGLPNDQALRLVTAEAALALGLERELGSVEAGKLADLLIVDGNPLTRMRDSLNIVAVVKDGIWYDREALFELD